MNRKSFTLIGAGMVLLLVACGTSENDKQGPTSATENQENVAGGSGSGMMPGCPMDMMQDVSFTLSDQPMGISVDFTTSQAEKVDRLRMMVKHMAEMWSSSGGGNGAGHEGHHGTGSGGGMGGGMGGMGGGTGSGCGMGTGMGGMNGGNCNMNMMQGLFQGAAIEALDIEAGARLTFTARNSQQVDGLRTAVRSHFAGMLDGKCPMMK